MIDSLFIGYLHFPTVLRFFIMFMNEGIKIYFRMCYALCFMLKDEILAVTYIYINKILYFSAK